MRLDRVYIDGFKNLKKTEADFDEQHLTSVIIGQNGAGKSNLIEAIVDVFRFVDINKGAPRFTYEIDYRIGGKRVRLTNTEGSPAIYCDDQKLSRSRFDQDKSIYFPDLIFGYYSGGSRRLEQLFDSHQRRYYDAIKLEQDAEKCRDALDNRRLFYCRPIHGTFALTAFFAYPKPAVKELLKEKLGVTGFHSALAVLREPWFAKSGRKTAAELWGAKGPAGRCAEHVRSAAFHPVALTNRPIDDYRDKGGTEPQLGLFLRTSDALASFAKSYTNDHELFHAIEAMDISDLLRDLHVWVTRKNDNSGDISFSDLSDGERQLLMVLGLIRVSRGKRALFMLDEPDTHLNPHWQHTYLDLIKQWTEVASDESRCHIVMTSHNPLTIAALKKEEVRVMSSNEDGTVSVKPPYTDPRGMGFTATLTEIFGLQTSLDSETQREIDLRNELSRVKRRSKKQERQLIELNDKLNRLGFMSEDRDPLYKDFLQSWHDVRYADRPPLTPEKIEARRRAMSSMIKALSGKKGGAS